MVLENESSFISIAKPLNNDYNDKAFKLKYKLALFRNRYVSKLIRDYWY